MCSNVSTLLAYERRSNNPWSERTAYPRIFFYLTVYFVPIIDDGDPNFNLSVLILGGVSWHHLNKRHKTSLSLKISSACMVLAMRRSFSELWEASPTSPYPSPLFPSSVDASPSFP